MNEEAVTMERIRSDVRAALDTLFERAMPQAGALLVLGCSTSEIMGERIGSCSSEEAAGAVLDVLLPYCEARGVRVAVQGCEHINRALCTDRATAEALGLSVVWVEPWLHAGGACVTEAKRRLPDAVMVEDLKGLAVLGLDIGGTLIGMHMRAFAVPVHPKGNVGAARVLAAFSRPKYIGGPRARYAENGTR